MNDKKVGLFKRVVNFLGKLANGFRTLISIGFVILFLVFIGGMFADNLEPLPEKGALYLAPSGILVDQRAYVPPLDQLLSDQSAMYAETVVRDIIKAVNSASTDPRITHLIIDTHYLEGAGIAKLEEISVALMNFRATDKPIIAMADNFTQAQYFLAAHADHIMLNPMGSVILNGFGAYRNYYRDALDKLKVNIHIFRAGAFKSATEPFSRNTMSELSREETSDRVNRLWQYYSATVETLRNLEKGSIDNYANNLHLNAQALGGDLSKLAQQQGLVDQLATRSEILDYLNAQIPGTQGEFDSVDMNTYLMHIEREELAAAAVAPLDKIAVVVAKGTILDGDQPEGTIGGDTLSQILNDLERDEQIKAVVLRVDSPGGSAFAAEIIRNAIGKVTERDILLVVSMGSYAASGGYWIAAEADSVLALSTTITGSIGVYGMIPTVEDSLAALGVYTDGVGSTDIAGIMRLDRPLSAQTKTLFQSSVEHIYDRFIKLVANGRDITIEAVDQIAQGRVWTGQQALELGLVDRLGDLNDAIQVAAELADIEQYRVEYLSRMLSPQELLVQQLSQNISASLAGLGLQPRWLSTELSSELSTELLSRARSALSPLTKLREFNDPRGIYLHCDNCPI